MKCCYLVVQLEDAERKIQKLEVEKRELVEEKQTLDSKLRRGSEAIKKVSKDQEKLESKMQKLSSDRDAAVAENKVSKAKVTSLEVRANPPAFVLQICVGGCFLEASKPGDTFVLPGNGRFGTAASHCGCQMAQSIVSKLRLV